jgi:hypothetical protein
MEVVPMKTAVKTLAPPRLVSRIDWDGMPDHAAEAHRLRAEAVAAAFCWLWRRLGLRSGRPGTRSAPDRARLA